MNANGEPPDDLVDEVVRRIRSVADPVRIILFGSAAREEWNENSGVDVMVVVSDGTLRRRTAPRICGHMIGVGHAVDVVVVTVNDVEQFRNSPATVIGPAIRDRKVLYAA